MICILLIHNAPRQVHVFDNNAVELNGVRFMGSTLWTDFQLTPAFASNLEELMGKHRVALWMNGHMHQPFDYRVHGTRVVCNPRGYAPDQLSAGFKADLVVQI